MGILAWIVLGLVAGWIASMIMKTNNQQGMMMDILVGIVGAFVGGLVMSVLGGTGITGFNFWSLGVAVLGAVILLWMRRALA